MYKTALSEKALFLNYEDNTLFLALEVKENLCDVTFNSFWGEISLLLFHHYEVFTQSQLNRRYYVH